MQENSEQKILKKDVLFDLGDHIDEISGAVYDVNQNVIWSLGDSSPMVLARTDVSTLETQVIDIEGVKGGDREELVIDSEGYLWILCTGDNHKRRERVFMNQVDQRVLEKGKALKVMRTIETNYPKGAIDVEGAFVYGRKLFLIQKSFFKKAKIYTIDISPGSEPKQMATHFNSIYGFPHLATGACIDENDQVFFVTYWGVFKILDWKNNPEDLRVKLVEFGPFFGQTETILCHKNRLIVARESGLFFYSKKRKP